MRETEAVKRACLLSCGALALASCGGSGRSKHSTSPTQAITQSTQSQTTSATASSIASARSTAVGTPVPPCRAADLAVSYLGGQGATGHGELGFTLRNTSSSNCRTFGYPGVLFLDQHGAPLPTVPSRTTQDYFGSAPEQRLMLAPGQVVSFRLGVTHGIASTAGCTTAYGLQVIPPDDTSTLRAAIRGGAYECRTVTVSPLRPGTTAYP